MLFAYPRVPRCTLLRQQPSNHTALTARAGNSIHAAQSLKAVKGLHQIAVIESTESSNQLEDVVVPSRLKFLVILHATPKSRSGQNITSCHDSRALIYESTAHMPFNESSAAIARPARPLQLCHVSFINLEHISEGIKNNMMPHTGSTTSGRVAASDKTKILRWTLK